MHPLIVTGTDTGVGKTVVTAAIAVAATAAGLRTAVLKPGQTGGDDDAGTVARLAGTDARTLARYPDPLSPAAAARASGLPPLSIDEVLDAVAASDADVLLVEGAGGLLVPMGEEDWTVADLCTALDAPAVVVARAGLGTLNHTALTLEALAAREIAAHVVVGAMPAVPALVHTTNLATLDEMSGGLAGVLPEGAGSMAPEEFRAAAPGWLGCDLYGTFTG